MKRPSPALVISCVALFVSLGGTGLAATQLHGTDAKAKSKSKALTSAQVAQVNKLIAGYIAGHHIVGERGPQGLPGAPGTAGKDGLEGKVGPQGPGATALSFDMTSFQSPEEVTVGPWKLTIECIGGEAAFEIRSAAGMFAYTEMAGSTPVLKQYEFSKGAFLKKVASAHQLNLLGFLTSGTTDVQLNLQINAEISESIESCQFAGQAIPSGA